MIFGVTGGVTEAVLRRLSPEHTKEAMREISECGVRGEEGIKEFSVPYKDTQLNICVVSGLANARKVMDKVRRRRGELSSHRGYGVPPRLYHGRRTADRAGSRTKAARARGLYNADNTMIIKKSDENPLVIELYADC